MIFSENCPPSDREHAFRDHARRRVLRLWASPSLTGEKVSGHRGGRATFTTLGAPRGVAIFVADIAPMRLGIAFLVLAGACFGFSGQPVTAQEFAVAPIPQPVPLPRPRPVAPKPAWVEPLTFREAAGADFKSEEVTSAPS